METVSPTAVTAQVRTSSRAAAAGGASRPTRDAVSSSVRPASSWRLVSPMAVTTPRIGKRICPMNPTSTPVIPPRVSSA